MIGRLKGLRANPGLVPQDFVNAAAIAAWGDDTHVARRREVFQQKKELFTSFFSEVGICSPFSSAGVIRRETVLGRFRTAPAQVSSTRVRACLAAGDVEQAARLLGRPHRLVLDVASANAVSTTRGSETATYPLCAAQNQYPAVGTYDGVLPNDSGGVETNARSVRVTVRVTETDVAVTAPRAADLAAFAGGVDLVSRARR